jgi:hypothetical protein
MSATQPISAPHPTASLDRRILVGGGALAILFVAILAVALVVGARPASYPAGSPEAAFQAFVQASETGDTEAAYALLSPRIRSTWTYTAFDQQQRMYGDGGDRTLVYIDRTVSRGDDAVALYLTIEHVYGEGLTSSRWTERDVPVRMALVDGTWYVDQALAGTQEMYK